MPEICELSWRVANDERGVLSHNLECLADVESVRPRENALAKLRCLDGIVPAHIRLGAGGGPEARLDEGLRRLKLFLSEPTQVSL